MPFDSSLHTPGPQRWWRPALIGLLALCPVLVGALLGYRLSERAGLSQLAAVANERLELYAATLEAELARFAYLPSLIASEPDVQALLAAPADAALRERAGRTLARVGVRAGANLIVVASPSGEQLATSSPQRGSGGGAPGIANALKDGAADFFAANESDGSTDYYFTQPVQRDERALGQIVVKVNLAPLEATWIDLGLRTQSERLLLVDENEVVVMSSVAAWKYRTVGDAAPRHSSHRYAAASLAPLHLDRERKIEPGVALVRVPGQEDQPAASLLAQERPIVPLAARLMALSDPTLVRRQARNAAWGGGAGGALLGVLMLYAMHRRRALRQLFQARNALQQAHDQLELQVHERTRQLRSTNEELTSQIAQRVQAEGELMQAGKLAVLGQMSAGISHEINQPLTALRALSRNAIRLLDGGRTLDVASNLRNIDEMAERMGRIVNQLKSFTRKDSLTLHPVTLADAVRNVLLMLDHRLQSPHIEVQVDVPDDLQARGDTTRLEQVLLNLAGNAIDAMADAPERRLRLHAQRVGERVRIAVDDTGAGMGEAQMQRLFEPFFTTKAAGQGLGLGLVISSKIVRELGGTLRAERLTPGMCFTFDLADATTDASATEEHHV
ncbi:MAG: sensor histidine kinase [Burkholderiales bacterium]|nr:sensor histidine kinase [Burkholderiales bacterium]